MHRDDPIRYDEFRARETAFHLPRPDLRRHFQVSLAVAAVLAVALLFAGVTTVKTVMTKSVAVASQAAILR